MALVRKLVLVAAAALTLSAAGYTSLPIPVFRSGPQIGVESPRMHGAKGDGATDDRAALAAADSAGKTLTLPAGTYRVGSNLTLSSRVRFEHGAKLKPASGVQVTLAAGYEAGPLQHVFDLSAGGTCWSLVPCDATQYHWGAVGDGVADDTAAIQACIDNAYYFDNARTCRLARGTHLVTRLMVGWGSTTSYGSLTLCGAKDPYGANPTLFGGTVLVTASWENAIEVRSARRAVIRDLAIVGPWKSHIEANALGHSTAVLDSSDALVWRPSGMPTDAIHRFSFSAGIHVDPRCGTAPTPKYSDVTYPSYATPAGSAQYGLSPSSQVTIEHCTIAGFGAAVAVQGCNFDSQGDFLAIKDSEITKCLYGVVWGNTQNRQVSAEDTRFTNCWTCFDTDTIGGQTGRPQIRATGCSFDQCFQVVNSARVDWGGYCLLDGCYAELLYRIGNFFHGASGAGAGLSIRDCHFAFSSAGGYANTQHSFVSVLRTPLRISGGCIDLTNCTVPFLIQGEPRLCEVSTAITNANWTAGNTVSRAIAAGATCHIMFLNATQGPWRGSGYYSPAYNPSTGSAVTNDDRQRYGAHALSNCTRVIPFCADRASGSSSAAMLPTPVALGGYRYTVAGAAATGISHSGRVLTFTHTQTTTNVGHLQNWGMTKGSLFYHDGTGNLYVIDSHASGVTTATLLNNYVKATGAPAATPGATGTYYYIPAGHYVPSSSYELLYTASSSSVTFKKGDGSTNGAAADMPVGSAKVCADFFEAGLPINQGNSAISSVVDGTLTMSGAARSSACNLFQKNTSDALVHLEPAGLWYVPRP